MKRPKHKIAVLLGILLLTATLAAAQENLFEIPAEQIRQGINSYIDRQLSGLDAGCEVEWLREIPEVKLLEQPDSLSVTHGGNGIPLGNEVFTVIFYRHGKALRSIYISARLHVTMTVWVTRERISRDMPLSEIALVKEKRDISAVRGVPLGIGENMNRLVSRRFLPAGRVVVEADVRAPFMVRKGHRLDLEYRKGGLHLSLEVRAMQNAAKGDVIWVKNPETRKRMRAKVLGPDLAVLY